jgi:hypothetical protein
VRIVSVTTATDLRARIIERRALRYDDAAPVGDDDRPPFVRAASGLAWLGDELAIIQDDAAYLALVDARGRVRSVTLPPGPGGRRRFEKRLGNKNDKLDLEACFALGDRLIAFGSGALPRREVIAVVARGDVRVVEAPALYARVRAALGPAAVLNLEGACAQGDRLRLFQRGNGAPIGVIDPVDASVDLDLAAFLAWLDGGAAVPEIVDTAWYVLGAVSGVRFGFTDVHAVDAGHAMVLAAAEGSPDAIDDGAVLGARIGVLEGSAARMTDLLAEDGAPAIAKAEGIVLARERGDRALVVLDADDPDLPSELCTVELSGPWPSC